MNAKFCFECIGFRDARIFSDDHLSLRSLRMFRVQYTSFCSTMVTGYLPFLLLSYRVREVYFFYRCRCIPSSGGVVLLDFSLETGPSLSQLKTVTKCG